MPGPTPSIRIATPGNPCPVAQASWRRRLRGGGDALFVLGGGSDGSTEAVAWSLGRGGWQAEPAMTLPVPRKSAAAAVVGDAAYIIGGFERPMT